MPVSVVLVCVLAAFLLAGSCEAASTPPSADHAPISIQPGGDAFSVRATEQDPHAVAVALRDASGLKIDGLDVLRGLPPITFQFETIPAAAVLNLLAMHADTLLRRDGPQHFQFGVPGEASRLGALYSAWIAADDADSATALAAETALLDFIRSPPEGPVVLGAGVWLEAAQRAERQEDLARATSHLREAVAHTKRRDGAQGAEYGLALSRLGRILGRQGDVAQDQLLTEQGLAIAEAERGPIHADLTGMQVAVADFRRSTNRHAEAEELYRRAVKGYGEPDADSMEALGLGFALDGLATLLQQQGRWAESIPLLERSFSLHRDVFGDDAAGFQAWLLGIAQFNQDRLTEAKPMLQFAITHAAPGRRSSEQLLATIRLLGPFARPDAVATDLPQLLSLIAAAPESAMISLAAGLLEDRALRQLRESPESNAWRTSCAAFAIVMTPDPRKHDSDLLDQLHQRSAQRCEERARAGLSGAGS